MGTNTIISDMFAKMADALASQGRAAKGHPHNHIINKKGGANPFKIAAYRKAAKVLAEYPIDVEEAYRGAAPYHSDILIDGVSLCDTSRL
jgi:hypothetical protein